MRILVNKGFLAKIGIIRGFQPDKRFVINYLQMPRGAPTWEAPTINPSAPQAIELPVVHLDGGLPALCIEAVRRHRST